MFLNQDSHHKFTFHKIQVGMTGMFQSLLHHRPTEWWNKGGGNSRQGISMFSGNCMNAKPLKYGAKILSQPPLLPAIVTL